MTWADAARDQHGVVSRGQLRLDLSDSAITRLAAAGALTTVATGVFLVRGAPRTYAADLWIAVLATGGVLGLGTSTHLWGADDQPARICVLLEESRHIAPPPGVRLVRTYTHRGRSSSVTVGP